MSARRWSRSRSGDRSKLNWQNILHISSGSATSDARRDFKTRWTRIGYALFNPLLPLVRALAPGAVITTEELGRAMIRVARQGAPKRVLENRELIELGTVPND